MARDLASHRATAGPNYDDDMKLNSIRMSIINNLLNKYMTCQN